MSEGPVLFDPGLQPERTELAWRRTALAIGVGSLVVLRILPEMLGSALWVVPGIAGLAFAALLWIVARRRAVQYSAVLTRRSGRELPGGGLLAVVTGFVLACGAGAVLLAVSVGL